MQKKILWGVGFCSLTYVTPTPIYLTIRHVLLIFLTRYFSEGQVERIGNFMTAGENVETTGSDGPTADGGERLVEKSGIAFKKTAEVRPEGTDGPEGLYC